MGIFWNSFWDFSHSLKMKKTGKRKKKEEGLVLKFDAEERKEFLTGFRKRKLQRKAKAREELARQIKAEKARINKEKAEESKKKNELLEEYVKQFVPEETEEVIDSENQTVTIKAVEMNPGLDYEKLKQESDEIDGLKAKEVKKNDMQAKKLKKLESKAQSLRDKKKNKGNRKLGGDGKVEKGGKSGKKGGQKGGKK